MGISCSIMFEENSNISATHLYTTIEQICLNKNLYFAINMKEVDENGAVKVIRTNISDIPFKQSTFRQLSLDIFDEPYKFKSNSFEWFDDSINFFEAIVIDYFDENEDLLFLIADDVLSQYPTAKVWIEEEWFYTVKDFERIKNKQFDSEWCYKNPNEGY